MSAEWVERAGSRRPKVVLEPLARQAWVSQLGTRERYREKPRFDRPGGRSEWDVSVSAGRHPVDELTIAAFGRRAKVKDTVRNLSVGLLGDSDYRALATPHPGNPSHASLMAPVDHHSDPHGARLWWDRPQRVTLESIAQQSSAEG